MTMTAMIIRPVMIRRMPAAQANDDGEGGKRQRRRKASHGKQPASIDGELAYLESPIDIVSDHLALRLVMPPEAAKS